MSERMDWLFGKTTTSTDNAQSARMQWLAETPDAARQEEHAAQSVFQTGETTPPALRATSPDKGRQTGEATPQSAEPTAPLTQGSLAGTGRNVEQVQQEKPLTVADYDKLIREKETRLAELENEWRYKNNYTYEEKQAYLKEKNDIEEQIEALEDSLTAPNTNAERESLIRRMNDITANEGYATTVELADAVTQEKQEVRQRLHQLDEELGNAARFYDSGERAPAVVKGAVKQTGAAYTNFMGTLQGLGNRAHEASSAADQAVAGSDYAGWATDELTAANMAQAIMKENPDGNYLEGLQKEEQRLYEKADAIAKSAAKDIGQAKEGLSALGKAGVDISTNVIQLGIDAAGKAAGLGMIPFFVRAAGGAMQEARHAGAGTGEQFVYGIIKGANEVGTEMLFGGIGGTGTSGLDKVFRPLVDKLSGSATGKIALNAIYRAATEGAEEGIADLLDPFAKLIYNDQAVKEAWENRDEFKAQMLYDYLIGAAIGGLGSVPNIVTGVATGEAFAGKPVLEDTEAQTEVQTEQPATQQGTAAVEDILRSGRVSNTAANDILNNASLAAQFEDITGVKLDGTREENRRAIQRAAREYAYNAQMSDAAAQEAAVQAETEEAVRTSGYGAYIRGVLKDGATVDIAREIINNPGMRATWEQMTGKTLPENQTSAIKMIMQTRRKNPVIPAAQPVQQAGETTPPALRATSPDKGRLAGEATPQSAGTADSSPYTGEPTTPQSVAEERATARVAPTAPTREAVESAPANAQQETQAQAAETAQETQRATPQAETPPTAQNATQTASGALNRQEETTAQRQETSAAQNTAPAADNQTTGQREQPEGANAVRGFSINIATDSAMEMALREDIAANPDLYKRLSNKETLQKALDIFAQGFDTARTELERAIGAAQSGQKFPIEMVPLSRMVVNELTRRGDLPAARKITSDVAAELTGAGELGQAGAILRNADPITVLNTLQKAIDQINAEMAKKFGKRNKWTAELTAEEIKQISETDFSQEGAFEAIQQQIAERLGREMPATLMEKLREIRKVGMLANPKTQIKNRWGNIPLKYERKVAEKLSGGLQELAVKAGIMSKEEQTRTLRVSKESKDLAKSVYENNIDRIKRKGNKGERRGILNDTRTYFNKGLLQKGIEKATGHQLNDAALDYVRRFTYDCLEKGDAPFVKSAFIDSLAQYCEAQGIKAEADVTETAISYAIDQAMAATFKDASALANLLNSIKDNAGIAGQALDVLLPFTTTPINIANEFYKYSPLGYLQLLNAKGKSAAEVIDIISRATTGSAVVAAGAILRSLGVITGAADDDKDKAAADKAAGISPYSILGKYSYEWAQPTGSALAMGAAIYDAAEDGGSLIETLSNGVISAGDVYLEQSFYKDIIDLFQGYGSPTENVIRELLTGTASQFIPTIVGATARTIDPTVRTSYSGGNIIDDILAQAKVKTPGMSKSAPASVNVRGEEIQRGNLAQRILDNFIFPWTTNRNGGEENAVDEAINEVYADTADKTIFRQVSPYKVDYHGETYQMTGEEREQFQKTQGQVHDDILQQIIDGGQWKNLSNGEKVKIMQRVNEYALDSAKRELVEARGNEYSSDWDDEAALTDISSYFVAKIKADKDGNGRISQEELWYYLGLQKNMPKSTKTELWDVLTTGKTGYAQYAEKQK